MTKYVKETTFDPNIIFPQPRNDYDIDMQHALQDMLTNITNVLHNVSDETIYFGVSTTNGSWRIKQDNNNLVFQRRESDVWVTKSTITP